MPPVRSSCRPVPKRARGRDAGFSMVEVMAAMAILAILATVAAGTMVRSFGITGSDYETVAKKLTEAFPLRTVAITLRVNPLVWRNSWTAIAYRSGQLLRTRTYEVEIVDRLGAGDSFAAGLIHGLLEDDLQLGLDYGVAMSALKHSIPGDFAWMGRDEVEALLQGGGLRISR